MLGLVLAKRLRAAAPASIERMEELLAPTMLGKGNTTKAVTDELLAALTLAYEEAASWAADACLILRER